MVFEGTGRSVAADLAGLGPIDDLSFDGYVLDHVHMHECDYNWKTFIEVYLEDYHVGPFHPGLGQFVTCDELRWEFGPQQTLNVVEFYYPEEIQAFEREFVEAEQAAYWETCAEDDEIALRMEDRKSTRLNSSHIQKSRMPSSA